MNRITRVEVIDENGRSYVNWEDDNNVSWQFQDDGRTLKVFVNKVKSKSPVEEAYYSVYGWYPPTTSSVSNYEDNRWRDFQNGYNAAYEEKVVEKETEREMIKRNLKTSLQELVNGDVRPIDDVVRETKNQQIKELVRESVKWCEEHPEESVEDYLRPKTPEQTEKSLKEAFVKVQQTEQWKETQRKIDAPKESWMNKSDEEPKPMDDVIDRLLEKYKSQKLWNMLRNELGYSIDCCDEIVDLVEKWLPKEQSAEGSQNAFAIDATEGFNHCLNKIKGTLR